MSNTIVFGISSMTLGTGDAYVDWNLTSLINTGQYASITLTHATSAITFSAALYNGARGVVGSVIHYCTAQVTAGEPANRTRFSSNPFCAIGNTSNYDHNMVCEFSWQISGEPGYWYAYVRSVVSHTTVLGSSANYTFDAVNYLPGDSYGAGDNPNN